jgi:hypothetical protein
MKFAQIAGSAQNTAIAVPIITSRSVLLNDWIEFFVKPGTAATIRTEGLSTGIAAATRQLEQAYDSSVVRPQTTTVGRRFMGGEIKIDQAYQKMGYDIGNEFLTQLKRHMIDFPTIFHYLLIHGNPDADAKQFAGLNILTPGAQKVLAGANGLELLYGSDNAAKKSQQTFLEKINLLIERCKGTSKVLVMNDRVKAYFNTVAQGAIQQTVNSFGVAVDRYNNVPMINLGDVQTAPKVYEPILKFNETVGTSDNCSSIYCVNFAEEDGMSFMTTQGGFEVYDIVKDANWVKAQYELIVDSSLIRNNALAKLEGLKFGNENPA